ncbi:hypothetical protein ACFTAO_31235 [Paenibacillus rhizoplanae]
MIKIKLPLPQDRPEQRYTTRDHSLLRYAALNIAKELLDQEWNSTAFLFAGSGDYGHHPVG